jgi:flagellar biosynthesis protein FlhG
MNMEITEPKAVKTIVIASGKGGVGKTNITANLAVALSKTGKKVLVFDADLGLCNINVLLNLATKYTIKDLFMGEMRLKDIIVDGPGGIKILPASSGIQELTALDEFQRLRLIEEFELYDEDVDYLLIDAPSGISSNVAFFCTASQDIVIVASAEPTALTDAYALIKVLFINHQEKNFKVLINEVKNEAEATDVFMRLSDASEQFLSISLDYMGFIPYDESIPMAVRQQKALMEIYPESNAAKSFLRIAKSLNLNSENHLKGTLQIILGGLIKTSC